MYLTLKQVKLLPRRLADSFCCDMWQSANGYGPGSKLNHQGTAGLVLVSIYPSSILGTDFDPLSNHQSEMGVAHQFVSLGIMSTDGFFFFQLGGGGNHDKAVDTMTMVMFNAKGS